MWLVYPSIAVTNGSKIVNVVGGHSLAEIKPGDGLAVGGDIVEIESVLSDSIILRDIYDGATANGVVGRVVPTATDFNEAADVLRKATEVTAGNFEAMEKWWTQAGTVDFTGYDGTVYTVKTAQQVAIDMNGAEEVSVTSNATLVIQPTLIRVSGSGAIVITTNSGMHVNGLSFHVNVLSGVSSVTITDGSNINVITKHADDPLDKTGTYLVVRSNGRWVSTRVGNTLS